MIERASTIELDTTSYPLVVGRFRGGDTDADITGFLDELGVVARERFALVAITPARFSFLESRHAHMYAEWLIACEPLLRRNCAGAALVLRSAVARGAFKAVAAMAPIPFVIEHFRDEGKAIAWAQNRLREHRSESPELVI